MNGSSVCAAHDEPLGGLCRVWFGRRGAADQSVPLGIAHGRAGFALVCEAVAKLVPSLRIAGRGVVIRAVAVGVVEPAFDPYDELNHRAVHSAFPVVLRVPIATLAIVPCRRTKQRRFRCRFQDVRPEKKAAGVSKRSNAQLPFPDVRPEKPRV